MAAETILKVQNLQKYFSGIKAVDNVSFDVIKGQTLGVIGPNGAGKTTLFNTICGLYCPTGGDILLGNTRIHGLKPHQIAGLGIARTFQISHPFRDMSALDNVIMAMGGRNYDGFGSLFRTSRTKENIYKAEALLQKMQIAEQRDKRAGDLSLGYMRRLEIARALALEPKLLLLDEPCAGLSHDAAKDFVDILQELKAAGTTIMLVEHNMAIAMTVCDRLVVLSYGVKIAEGTPDEVKSNPLVIEAYLGRDDDIA